MRQVVWAQPSVGTARLVLDCVGAVVDPLRADARVEQDRARDLAVGASGRDHRTAGDVGIDPVHGTQRLVQRRAVCLCGAREQRPVDVEQEQHGRPFAEAQRSNEMPGSSRLANAAISFAALSMSAIDTISTGECM